MANGKQDNKKNEWIYEDFETYLPTYDFDDNQIQFFKDAFELLKDGNDR